MLGHVPYLLVPLLYTVQPTLCSSEPLAYRVSCADYLRGLHQCSRSGCAAGDVSAAAPAHRGACVETASLRLARPRATVVAPTGMACGQLPRNGLIPPGACDVGNLTPIADRTVSLVRPLVYDGAGDVGGVLAGGAIFHVREAAGLLGLGNDGQRVAMRSSTAARLQVMVDVACRCGSWMGADILATGASARAGPVPPAGVTPNVSYGPTAGDSPFICLTTSELALQRAMRSVSAIAGAGGPSSTACSLATSRAVPISLVRAGKSGLSLEALTRSPGSPPGYGSPMKSMAGGGAPGVCTSRKTPAHKALPTDALQVESHSTGLLADVPLGGSSPRTYGSPMSLSGPITAPPSSIKKASWTSPAAVVATGLVVDHAAGSRDALVYIDVSTGRFLFRKKKTYPRLAVRADAKLNVVVARISGTCISQRANGGKVACARRRAVVWARAGGGAGASTRAPQPLRRPTEIT